jgi:hypothetical protein
MELVSKYCILPMLHGDPSPPKKITYTLLGTPSRTCWPSPKRSRQISGTSRTDFEDVLGRFQGFSGQISGTSQTDFEDVRGRIQGFSGQISGIFQAYIFSFGNHGN